MNTDKASCEAPGCGDATDSYLDLWSCYHMFFLCLPHMLVFVNTLKAGHTGYCPDCHTAFSDGKVGFVLEGKHV
jgi:hypothetical protein